VSGPSRAPSGPPVDQIDDAGSAVAFGWTISTPWNSSRISLLVWLHVVTHPQDFDVVLLLGCEIEALGTATEKVVKHVRDDDLSCPHPRGRHHGRRAASTQP
jgi:hypothetical protein